MARLFAAVSLWLVALAAPAHAQAPRWIPEAGSYPYRYETVTNVPNAPGQRFRIDYDLVSDGKGGIVAVVKAAGASTNGTEWSDVEVDDTCRAALHGQGTELARVTLWPLALTTITNLDTGFMAECAPTEIFFPMLDVLKFTLIQVAPHFRLNELQKPGDTRPFPGQKTEFDRLDTVLSVDSPGGTLQYASLDQGRATIGYHADPSKVRMIHRRAYSGADITLTGTESAVHQIVIDTRTGVLLSVETTRSELDMVMSLPGDFTQPMKITREMRIVPRP